jgi:hypothetical protein
LLLGRTVRLLPDVSGKRIGAIFKVRDVKGIFIPEDETGTLPRNVDHKPNAS